MSIFRLSKDNFENFELVANPGRQFSSSSLGITGSVTLFADSSPSIKELASTFGNASGSFNDNTLDIVRAQIAEKVASGSTGDTLLNNNVLNDAEDYLELVNSQNTSPFLNKKQEILRFTPGVTFEENYLRKSAVKNILFPFYRNIYPTAQWGYTNYNTLNFVTGGNLPTESVLIYPAGTGSVELEDYNPLAPSERFTFDFWINPRYTTENVGDEFHAGTILHMSSCYAISMVTGSSIGIDGKPSGYRMMLQLSHSADTNPSDIDLSIDNNSRSHPNDLVFLSDDNVLTKNTWHHVAIRWDSNFNNGTGSFFIDNKVNGSYSIPSSSVMQITSSNTDLLDPDALFVGNYYSGDNNGSNAIAKFFNNGAHVEEGVMLFNDNLTTDPSEFSFTNPLNAEVHDIKIFDQYRSDKLTLANSKTGVNLTEDGLLFYVPPFFTKDTRERLVLQTPFFDARGSTEDPFNVALSFGVGGMSINLENFTKDLVTNQFPRLLNLSASRIDTQINIPQTANSLLYKSGSNRKRNLTITPCDNGQFFPNFNLLADKPSAGIFNAVSGSSSTLTYSGSYDDRFKNDFGNIDYSLIGLNSMVETGSVGNNLNLVFGRVPDGQENPGSLLTPLAPATPEDPGVSPGNILSILQRQHDPSSNEVVLFDVSNMFYGDRIQPGTFIIEDLAVSGSDGRMTFKLKDNGRGNLYRADALSTHAKWSSVGNVLYDEGIIVIKTPHMPFFGKDSFKVTFDGKRSVYVLEVTVTAEQSQFNSSNNPTYKELAPSDYPSELADKFTYLTAITLHDNNLNVIGRAHLAQPVIKRDDDRLVFKLRMDY